MLELSALRENGCNEDRRDFKLCAFFRVFSSLHADTPKLFFFCDRGVDTFEVDITGNRVATDEAEEGDAERTVFRCAVASCPIAWLYLAEFLKKAPKLGSAQIM